MSSIVLHEASAGKKLTTQGTRAANQEKVVTAKERARPAVKSQGLQLSPVAALEDTAVP